MPVESATFSWNRLSRQRRKNSRGSMIGRDSYFILSPGLVGAKNRQSCPPLVTHIQVVKPAA
jgi:hypothetical protein